MKNLNFNTQICTTIEQSKRLLKFGLDADTSDMCWLAKKLWGDDVEIPEGDRSYILSTDKDDSFCSRYDVDCVPAWSLHRLIAMLPELVGCSSLVLYKDSLSYINQNLFINFYSTAYFRDYNNLYDNIIDCIEWLIEDGNFNKEYLKEI